VKNPANKTSFEIDAFIRTTWANLWASEGMVPAIREIRVLFALEVRFSTLNLGFWMGSGPEGYLLGFDTEIPPGACQDVQDVRAMGQMMVRMADLAEATRDFLTK
jgi:hypothetical protein